MKVNWWTFFYGFVFGLGVTSFASGVAAGEVGWGLVISHSPAALMPLAAWSDVRLGDKITELRSKRDDG